MDKQIFFWHVIDISDSKIFLPVEKTTISIEKRLSTQGTYYDKYVFRFENTIYTSYNKPKLINLINLQSQLNSSNDK